MKWVSQKERQKLKEANKKFYKKKKHKRKKKKSLTYAEYLKTDRWKQKRLKVLKRAKYKCEICKINQAWQVHHKNYKRIFKEKLTDLIAVCETCHKGEHNLLTEEEIELAVMDLVNKY